MRVVLLGALLALPALAHVPSTMASSGQCKQKPRSVALQTGINIDLVYCTDTPDITTTVQNQNPASDGKFYTVITDSINREQGAYVLIYKPNGNWTVPAHSLDSMGALILQEGDAVTGGTGQSGWVAKQDSRFSHRSLDWLQARQIVMHNPGTREWIYYRIILDTRHNLLYVLYQRDDEGGPNQENSFFDSFTVDASVTVDPGNTPGAHLPPPYPNP
jgi:hypothetical protein